MFRKFWKWLKEIFTIKGKRKKNIKYSRGQIKARDPKKVKEARRKFVEDIKNSTREEKKVPKIIKKDRL